MFFANVETINKRQDYLRLAHDYRSLVLFCFAFLFVCASGCASARAHTQNKTRQQSRLFGY